MTNLENYIQFSHLHNIYIPPIVPGDISVIIPVKNEQAGINNFLYSFFSTNIKKTYPKEFIIVDNNSFPPIRIADSFYKKGVKIIVLKCYAKGPAAARNTGANSASGKWLLFTDHDCIASKSIISGYTQKKASAIAYAGEVKSLKSCKMSRYYESQRVLKPPDAYYRSQKNIPMYATTANALVLKKAYEMVGGFDESFVYAAAEDVDFSLRLWRIGKIDHCQDSIVFHDFKNSWYDFIKRFIRYGKGNKMLEVKYGVNKYPKDVIPKIKSRFNKIAAFVQLLSMRRGYHSI